MEFCSWSAGLESDAITAIVFSHMRILLYIGRLHEGSDLGLSFQVI